MFFEEKPMSRNSRLMWSTVCAFVLATSLHAAAPPDTIQAKGGAITIQPITHAALQLKYANQVITVDPTMMGGDYNALSKADIILVTDIHGDHLDPSTIEKASKTGTTVVIPSAASSQVKYGTTIANGDTKT